MKRKNLYRATTFLLVGLGAVGSFYLVSGGEAKKPPENASAAANKNQSPKQADAIEIKPAEEDDFWSDSAASTVDAQNAGYQQQQAQLGASPSYMPIPASGSTTQPTQKPVFDATGIAGGSDSYRSGYGGNAGSQSPAADIHSPAAQVDTTHQAMITRGQQPSSDDTSADGDGNSLRSGAAGAFASEGAPASRYGNQNSSTVDSPRAEISEAAPPLADELPYEQSGYSSQSDAVASGDLQTYDASQRPTEISPAAPAPIDIPDNGAAPISAQPVSGVAASQLDERSVEAFVGATDDYNASAAATPAQEYAPSLPAIASNPAYAQQPWDQQHGNANAAPTTDSYAQVDNTADITPYAVENSQAIASSQPATFGVTGTGQPGDAALEGVQSPQISIEKIAPSEIQVGKEATFSIIVRNTGNVAARDVVIRDQVPRGTQLVNTTPPATQDSGYIAWNVGELRPGDEKSVEVRLMPVEEGDIGSVATVHFGAAASARARCTKPMLQVRTEVAKQVMIGEQQIVSISLHNPGSGDATGVMLLENVPAGMSHPHGASLELEVGTLRAGETRSLDLVLNAEQAGVVQNLIVATADANLQAEDVTQFEVIAPALAVAVVGQKGKYLERPASFTLAVSNPGTATATDVELVCQLPRGMEFVSADKFGEYDHQAHQVVWSLAELPPNKRGTVEIVTKPVELGEQRVQVESRANMGLVDQTESALRVEGLSALKFEVTDLEDPVEIGGTTTYEIRVVNQGSKSARNVQVVAHLPSGLQATAAKGASRESLGPGRVVFEPLAELSPKADTTYRITVQGVQPGDQRIRVELTTADITKPITEEESTKVYSD